MALIELNEESAKEKLQLFTKYPYQVVTIVLGLCIGYLFVGQRSLEKEFREYIKESNERLTTIIVDNTTVLKEVKILNEKK
jgi:hypothetical protein